MMVTAFGKAVKLALAAGAAALCSIAVAAQEASPESTSDEIIVVGRTSQLRHELWLAEEAVFERFNEINSDDRFDIHCRWELPIDTHIRHRMCTSNSWREEDANIAQAFIGALRGEAGQNMGAPRGHQLDMNRRLLKELKQLMSEDQELHEAGLRLGSAYLALAGETGLAPGKTLSRQVAPGDDGLPFDAQRLFEVRMGRDPWTHPLTQRTFTIASLSGDIGRLDLKCDRGSTRLEYQSGVDWTVPRAWSDCTLRVAAKRDTTFQLYEFLSPASPEPSFDQ
jgi:hypothetical protein